ncbi:hypothetical protein JVT61DRAFT_13277 [Boletus reticuloceps]|uniref:Uncharacterized protein n=1 Tax=Boletus reticuloceps TaxID=495285 RepID=A0A8I2YWK2_9AGAM|nr:hypothetical protein JVT61DRAFT_13277 [Boletus reticuloceps]
MMEPLEETISKALLHLNESQTAVSLDAAVEDRVEEIESLLNGIEVDKELEEGTLQDWCITGDLPDDGPAKQWCLDSTPSSSLTLQPHNGNIDQLATNLKDASKGVVVDTTLSDYANYWNQFKEFAVTIGRAKSPSEVDALFPNIPADFPTWIALWIMHKCDETDVWTGKAKLPSDPRSTYGTAQKIGWSIQQFQANGLETLPCLLLFHSTCLSSWIMILSSKVRSGEAITSARAMDMATMKQLYDFVGSVKPKEYGPTPRKHKAENPSEWAGQRIRRMLYLLYLVSVLCLLHFDEALRITWADVVFQVRDLSVSNHWQNTTLERLAKLRPEHFRIQLNLPFRKTHQYGGTA